MSVRAKRRVRRGGVDFFYGVPRQLAQSPMAYAEARCSCGWRQEYFHGEAALRGLEAHRRECAR